jgi:hypothetical protein
MDPDYDEDEFDEELEGDELDEELSREMFADPGGRSALRAATPDNPRIYPCPTCRTPNMLTAKDVARSYQCNRCADHDEGGF